MQAAQLCLRGVYRGNCVIVSRCEASSPSRTRCVKLSDDDVRGILASGHAVQRDDVLELPDALLVNRDEIALENNRLGGGSSGDVYLGTYGKRTVAVKFVSEDDEELRAFKHEVSITSSLQHERVVELVGCCHASLVDPPSIVMEYVQGVNLEKVIHGSRWLDGVETRLQILLDVARALKFLHSLDVVHKDVKPSNVLVEQVSMRAKLIDFGLSSHLDPRRCNDFGDPHTWYMAPEIARDSRVTSKAMDVWSFGVMAWELFSGRQPYPDFRKLGDDLLMRCRIARGKATLSMSYVAEDDCPQEARRLIELCLEREPDSRPSFEQICDSLDRLLELRGAEPPENPVDAMQLMTT